MEIETIKPKIINRFLGNMIGYKLIIVDYDWL